MASHSQPAPQAQEVKEPCIASFAQQPSRPSPLHRRAIFFPADQEKPRMIWMMCHFHEIQDAEPDWSLVGPVIPYLRTIQGQHGHETVTLLFRDKFLLDGSAPNLSIATAIKMPETLKRLPRGPHVAYKRLSNGSIADITLADFRLAIEYLLEYSTGPHQNPRFKLQPPSRVHPDVSAIQPLDSLFGLKLLAQLHDFVRASPPAHETTEESRSHN
ncbi:hypothetical protein ZTR_07773 [Talaromyces verruculosus]|nr:hypothetical protein ZTR_07773 [Talaromyces verruculosus]